MAKNSSVVGRMKEHPILFSSPMVRAILDGHKSQTRRVVKLPHSNSLGQWEPTTVGGPNGGRKTTGEAIPEQGAIWHTRTGDLLICPYGQPGDRLWVKETFRLPAPWRGDVAKNKRAHAEANGIYSVIEWSRTTRGGRQFSLLTQLEEPTACSSAYGLCE